MDFVSEVRKRLDIPPAEREEVMKEIEDHYSELREELQADGMNECEAATEAARRLGNPGKIADEIQTVHCRAGWKTAILAATPCIFRMLHASLTGGLRTSVLLPLNLAILGLVMFPIVREWRCGRRPIWLATWSAFAFALASALSRELGSNIYGLFMAKESWATNVEQSTWIILLSLFSISLLRGRPRWQLALGVVAAAQMVAAFFYNNTGWEYLLAYAYWLFGIPMITALGAFGNYRLGDPMPASLFLFFVWASPFFPEYSSLALCLICMAAVVSFARGRSQAEKALFILLGMATIDLSSLILLPAHDGTLIKDLRAMSELSVFVACHVIYVVVIPMLYGIRKRMRQRRDLSLGV